MPPEVAYLGRPMKTLHTLLALALAASLVPAAGCTPLADLLSDGEQSSTEEEEDDDEEEERARKKKAKKKREARKKAEAAAQAKKKVAEKNGIGKDDGFMADTGFRPEKHGYSFPNTGGRFPRTPPIVDEAVMVKLFGEDVCVGANTKRCRLTPPAEEWSFMINRALNGGQCEGMAVSALTIFKEIDKPRPLLGASAARAVRRDEVQPLIAYYAAFQAVDPLVRNVIQGRRTTTPKDALEKLQSMWKRGEMATLGFWGPPGQGGHAVTPYAIEDRGNGISWIKIYDNNYPGRERRIEIDTKANTWKYDLASINPSVPKMPWGGDAENRSLVVIPLNLRLEKAKCPFCRFSSGKKSKTVWPRSTAVSIVDQDGRKLGIEDGKLVNEIPDAEIVELTGFLPDGAALEPIYILPDDGDYDISVSTTQAPTGSEPKGEAPTQEERGVTVFGESSAFTIEGVKLAKGEKDTLSVPRDNSGVRYRSGGGAMPALKLAVDDGKIGTSVRIANLKAGADDEVELKMDRAAGRVLVQGGGKASESYDLKMKRVRADGDDDEVVEQTGVRFKFGESHQIDAKPGPRLGAGAKPLPPRIQRGVFKPRPKPALLPKPAEGGEAAEGAAKPRIPLTPQAGGAGAGAPQPKPGADKVLAPKPGLPKPGGPAPTAAPKPVIRPKL